jgi:hypothetical protein
MLRYILLIITALFLVNCSTGVERSQNPGIVKIVLQSDQTDTSIVILDKIYAVDSSSFFSLQISQGKVYIDSFFSELLPELDDFQDNGRIYNILEKEDGVYKSIKLFETFAPVDDYTKLQFAVNANFLKIGGFLTPIELPEDAELLMDFERNFSVREDKTTEITIKIEPLRSVIRYKDSFHFLRKLEILNISYH